jgi:cytochrome c oxidase cbb3-type subunit 3
MFRAHFYLLMLITPVLVGCDRESRDFQTDAQMSSTVATTRDSGLDADKKPQFDVGSASTITAIDATRFERNGFNLSQGQWLFTQMNCSTCHAAGGGGDIGPTLSDSRWIYGSEPSQVFHTIALGRPNGMPAYGRRLSQEQIWQLTAYVRSLSGLVPSTIAPGREDNLQTAIPPNSVSPQVPEQMSASPTASDSPPAGQ